MDAFDMEMQRDKFLRIFDSNIGDREGKENLTGIMTEACANIQLMFMRWLSAWRTCIRKISGSSTLF